MELRISTTTVDSFRLFKSSDWFTEDNLVNQITTPFEANPAMNFGKAYHRFLENGYETENALLKDDGSIYCLVEEPIIQPAIEFRTAHPLITHELKMTKQFEFGDYHITLVGQVDGLEGMIAHEHKTTPNADYDKYADSYQWRYYCEIFGVDIVQYNVFQLIGSEYSMKKATTDQEFYECIEKIKLNQFKMNRYPELKNDCIAMLSDFVRFIQIKELEAYFPMKKA